MDISNENLSLIRRYAASKKEGLIIGTKLQALYKIIQIHGIELDAKDSQWDKVKVLPLGNNEHIGMIHTPTKKGRFFPCIIKRILLENE